MWRWLAEILGVEGADRRTPLLQRRFTLSGEVVAWLRSEDCDATQRLAFVDLLLRLDSDPVRCSTAILRDGAPPGMRWAPFDDRRAIFVWDVATDSIRIVLCV